MRALQGRLLLGCVAAAASLLAAAPAHADDTVEGELYGVHADYFHEGESSTHWRLQTADGTIGVLPTTLPALTQGNNEVAIEDEDPGAGVAGPVNAAAPVATPTLGGHKVAVIAFNFVSDTGQPWTLTQIRSSIFTAGNSTNAFFQEESHDQLWFTGKTGNLDGDVFGWYTLPPPTGCSDLRSDAYNWANLAMAQASALNGFNPADYQHVMFVFPYYGKATGGWAGLGELPGKYSWINGGDNGVLTVRVTGHELGHNLGMHHADSWDCTGASGQRVPISDNCALTEYNDPFDVMGSVGSRHSNAWHLEQLGVLPPSNVQTVTTSGTYSMTSATDSAMPTTCAFRAGTQGPEG